ncbi:MAG: sugar ABC transporter permease [Chloroflexi bacterium]|nr:sugar ABC transporter permease [Chloroflexota bacterium]
MATISLDHAGSASTSPANPMRLSREEHERLRRRHARRRAFTAYAFLLPNAIFFIAFLLVPVVFLFYLTFHNGGIITPARFVGLENWQRAWSDDLVRTTIRNTVYYCLLAIPSVFIIGMFLALCLQRVPRGSGPFRSLFYIPTLTPYVLAALIWLFVVQRDFGALNVFLGLFGIPPQNWLGSPSLVMPSIAMLEVWRGVGFWTLLFLAALLALPPELYQAATIDGASGLQQLRHITLPLMRPTFFFAVVMATIWNLQLFDSVSILTDGGPSNASATVVWYIYKAMFQFNDKTGFAAALSFVLLLFILALTLVEIRLLRKRT